MSARTKSATYFLQVVSDVSDIASYSRKLAEHLHSGLKELFNECEGKNMAAEWEKAAIDIETQTQEKLGEGESISSVWPAWRVRKSEIKSALKKGSDPNKFKNLQQFIDSAKADKPKHVDKDGKVTESNKATQAGNNTAPLAAVVNTAMPDEVRKRLDKALKALAQLPEAEALAVLDNFNGAIHAKLRKIGGRFVNVGSKTA